MKSLMNQDADIMKKQKKQLNEEDKMTQIMSFIRTVSHETKSKIYVTDIIKKIKSDSRIRCNPDQI